MLTTKQRALIAALVADPVLVHAAQSCNVPERTARAWYAKEEFQQELEKAQQAVFTEQLKFYRRGLATAQRIHMAIMLNEKTQDAIRLRAAVEWQRLTIELQLTGPLEKRIEELENIIRDRLE